MRFAAWQAGMRWFVADDVMQSRLRTAGPATEKFNIPAGLSVWGRGPVHERSAPPALWFCPGSAFKTHPQSTPAPAEPARRPA